MKNSISLFGLLCLAFLSFTPKASANSAAQTTGAQFEALVNKAQQSCPKLNCRNQPLHLVRLNSAQISRLSGPVRSRLLVAAKSIADIWPDTILEGGFDTDFNLKIDQIELVMFANQLVGYRIAFSAAAKDEDHHPGRIIEHGFMSSDLSTDFRDEAELAYFSAN